MYIYEFRSIFMPLLVLRRAVLSLLHDQCHKLGFKYNYNFMHC